MSPADQHDDPALDAEPESQPPASDPDVREALDRMEAERDVPEAEESADRDEDDDEQLDHPAEGDADEGDEAPTG